MLLLWLHQLKQYIAAQLMLCRPPSCSDHSVNVQITHIHISSIPPSCVFVAGHYVIIVSSGAVGVGCQRLGLANRPTKLAQKQALAAVGQVHLMRYYEDILNALGLVSCGVHSMRTADCSGCFTVACAQRTEIASAAAGVP